MLKVKTKNGVLHFRKKGADSTILADLAVIIRLCYNTAENPEAFKAAFFGVLAEEEDRIFQRDIHPVEVLRRMLRDVLGLKQVPEVQVVKIDVDELRKQLREEQEAGDDA